MRAFDEPGVDMNALLTVGKSSGSPSRRCRKAAASRCSGFWEPSTSGFDKPRGRAHGVLLLSLLLPVFVAVSGGGCDGNGGGAGDAKRILLNSTFDDADTEDLRSSFTGVSSKLSDDAERSKSPCPADECGGNLRGLIRGLSVA